MQVSRLTRTIAVLLLLSVLPMSGVCAPTGKGTVVTKTGYVYEGVAYVIDTVAGQLTITGPPARTFGLGEILTIYDEHGNEIARDRWAHLDQPTDSSGAQGGKRARRPIPHERPTVYFRIAPTWSGTGGDYYYSGILPGIGFSAGLSLRVSRVLALRFDYSDAGYGSDKVASHYRVAKKVLADGRLRIDAQRYTVSLEYIRIMNLSAWKLRMYYLYAGMGSIDHNYRARRFVYRGTGQSTSHTGRYSEAYPVAVAGVGARAMLTDNLGLDAGGAVHVIFLGKYAAGTGDTPQHHLATNIDGWVGLVVVL